LTISSFLSFAQDTRKTTLRAISTMQKTVIAFFIFLIPNFLFCAKLTILDYTKLTKLARVFYPAENASAFGTQKKAGLACLSVFNYSTGGRNFAWIAATASSAYSASIRTEILISLVEIIWMLMFLS